MKSNFGTIYLAILFLFSCSEKKSEYDAEYWAKNYCSCVESNLQTNNIYISRVLCDSKLANENRFFRAYSAQMLFGNYLSKVNTSYADSTLKFNNAFNNYIFKNCKQILP